MSTGGSLQVHLLGGFRVFVGSRAVAAAAWRQRRAAAVVKLLALEPGHRLHREQVMDALWPVLAPEAAANNLRFALHHARRQFEAASAAPGTFLTRDGDMLTLGPPDMVWVDLDAFEAAVAAAWRSQDLTLQQQAVACYAGDLLPADLYEDWVASRRTALRASYLTMLSRLAVWYEQRGEPEQAIVTLLQLLASEPTQEAAHVGLMRLYALGGQMRQALAQYEWLSDLLARELDAEPEPATRELAEAIRLGRFQATAQQAGKPAPADEVGADHPRPSAATGRTLPVPISTLIGRERELAELRQLLTTSQLLTLTGPGGIGKTRLALAVAHEVRDAYPDGVVFVSLAPIREPDLVISTMAQALEVCEQRGQSLFDLVRAHLHGKRLLLVLDNFEQVADAAPLLTELLEHSPQLTMLVTSRARLRLRGEQEYPVPPLSHPDPTRLPSPKMLVQYPAVALFLQRARAVKPGFQVTSESAPAIAAICQRLSGLPLAIELAAARSKVLAPQAILARLDRPLALLAGGPRDAPQRQQTMRDTIRWSYELLVPAEQCLFHCLSIFAGGWTLEAAESVVDLERAFGTTVLDGLTSLVDEHLVVQHELADREFRFSMLEPVREFARERLNADDRAIEVHERHACFFVALAEPTSFELLGPESQAWLDGLETEHENFRAVLRWTIDSGRTELGQRLAGGLWEFWKVRGYVSEGRRWLEAVLQPTDHAHTIARAEALRGAGELAQTQGEYEVGAHVLGESIALFRRIHDDHGIARVLNSMGILEMVQDELARSHAHLDESLAIFTRLGDEPWAARTRNNLSVVAILQGDYEQARRLLESNVGLYRSIGNQRGLAFALGNLGVVAHDQGDYEHSREWKEESLALFKTLGETREVAYAECNLGSGAYAVGDLDLARARFQHSLVLSRELGDRPLIASNLRLLGQVAVASGDPWRGAQLFGAAERLSESVQWNTPSPASQEDFDRSVADLHATLEESQIAKAWSFGRRMSLDEAIDGALA